MKKIKLTKWIACSLITASMIMLTPVGANAEWKQDNNGWWNTEGDSWSVGWKQIDGKWYYFNSDGYMEHDTSIDGYKLSSDGAWIQTAAANTGSENNSKLGTVTMKAEKSTYDLGTDKIKVNITNNTDSQVAYGEPYKVEKFENDKWNEIPFQEDKMFIEIAYLLNPKDTQSKVYSIKDLKDFNKLTAGKYRIVIKVGGVDVAGEFELK